MSSERGESATFIFAGGGTGGHIFPGLAVAEKLRELSGGAPGGDRTAVGREARPKAVARDAVARARCIFVCSNRPLDARILEGEGEEFVVIPAQPFGVRPRALVKFAGNWGSSLRAVRALIREERGRGGRVEMVAMGGFVAAPAARAAVVERVPLMLVNMDAIPGKANRLVAKQADRVVTSAPVAGAAGKTWERIPPIVRGRALAGMSAADCRGALGLDPAKATLLVTGASQGARSMNRMMMGLVQDRKELLRTWQVIHQTGGGAGDGEDDVVRAAYRAAGVPALVKPFFEKMGIAWGAADVAVSRAGAGSVAEAWANRVPTVFLPYPYHKDEHQKHNAKPLEEAGGAVIVKDLIEEQRNVHDPAGPGVVLSRLIHDVSQRERMRSALVALGPADGAERIARALLG